MLLKGSIEDIAWKISFFGIIALAIIVVIKLLLLKFTGKSSIGSKNDKGKINSSIKGSNLTKGDNPEGFIFGKLGKKKVYLENTKEGHITVFGGSGKGKTSALLIPSLRVWNAPFFAIDISGDISKNVMKKDDKDMLILSPDDPEESSLYNIFHSIDASMEAADKREKLEQLVNLIIDIPANANDTQRYFLNTGRKIYYAAMIAFYDIGLDFVDISKTVFFNDVPSLAKLIKKTENELALGYIMPVTKENEKNISGAKSALNDKIKLFADNEKMQKILRRPITDFEGNTEPCLHPSLIAEKKVFLKVPDRKQDYYASFMHIVVGQILEYISGRDYDPRTDKRILLGLDEFASIGHFEILSPIRKFRKNGANLCILTQSLADIDLVYSENERKVILDNSQYVVVLSATDNGTREYFSNLVGKEDTESESKSIGKGGISTNISKQREYAIKPEEWKTYANDLVVIHPSGYVKLKKNFYFKEK